MKPARPSRRRFLSTSLRGACAFPLIASCSGKSQASSSPSSPSGVTGPTARALFSQDFNTAAVGQYGADALAAGWLGVSPYNGVREGRTSIVEGADAREGRSLRVLYPKGGVSSEPSGAQWKMSIGRYDELYCGYSVRFAPGFDFVKGGKLPGFAGGAANTGGNKPSGRDGWSARMMWRVGGEVVQYVYHVDQPTIYGEDFDWNLGGQRVFRPGTWHRVEHRVVINTPGQRDGIVQGWFDGAMALDRRGIRFRDVDAFAIDAFYFSTFFGGSDPTWAAVKDEYAYFDQFVIATGRA